MYRIEAVALRYIHIESGIFCVVEVFRSKGGPVMLASRFPDGLSGESDGMVQINELTPGIPFVIQAAELDLELNIPVGRMPEPLQYFPDFDVSMLHGVKVQSGPKMRKDKPSRLYLSRSRQVQGARCNPDFARKRRDFFD